MRKCLSLFLILASFVFCAGFSARQKNVWEKIIILKTTRAEVEKMLNAPASTEDNVTYKLAEGTLSVTYAKGVCLDTTLPQKASDGVKAPKDAVIELKFFFEPPKKVSSFKFNMREFEIDFAAGGEGEGEIYVHKKSWDRYILDKENKNVVELEINQGKSLLMNRCK